MRNQPGFFVFSVSLGPVKNDAVRYDVLCTRLLQPGIEFQARGKMLTQGLVLSANSI